jgi:hypothetical protein
MIRHGGLCIGAVLAVAGAALPAQAIVFSGSSGTRAASAEFTTSGTNLLVRLRNTSSYDVMVPSDILTGVFFDISGSLMTLGRVSAVLAPGSVVTNGPAPSGGVVGGEWAYRTKTTFPGGFRFGISSAGFGDFGPGDLFPGPDLDPPASPDGANYGIASTGDNPSTHNGGANVPLIQDAVDFTLSGLPVGFDLSRILGVRFIYGTAYGEGQFDVPTPGVLALIGVGGLVATRRRR